MSSSNSKDSMNDIGLIKCIFTKEFQTMNVAIAIYSNTKDIEH